MRCAGIAVLRGMTAESGYLKTIGYIDLNTSIQYTASITAPRSRMSTETLLK